MKPLVVGQAPSRATDGRPPFSGRTGANLASLLGVPHRELLRLVDVVNLLPRWPGKAGRGDRFPIAEARAAAAMLLAVAPHDRIVAVGANVARALDIDGEGLRTVSNGRRAFLVVPHPSGLNRWFNEPENVAEASRALRAFVSADLRAVG